jgi:hypothetical protein
MELLQIGVEVRATWRRPRCHRRPSCRRRYRASPPFWRSSVSRHQLIVLAGEIERHAGRRSCCRQRRAWSSSWRGDELVSVAAACSGRARLLEQLLVVEQRQRAHGRRQAVILAAALHRRDDREEFASRSSHPGRRRAAAAGSACRRRNCRASHRRAAPRPDPAGRHRGGDLASGSRHRGRSSA